MGLTTEIKTHAIVTFTGAHHFLTSKQHANLKIAGLDDMITTYNGAKVKVSTIAEIYDNLEEYYATFPPKKSTDTHQKYSLIPQSFEDIVNEFAWATTAYQFPDMLSLVTLTHKKMEAWKGTFEEFCIKYQALTPSGDIIPAKYTDEKGDHSGVFAYPFFVAIHSLIEGRKEKARYAQERSWEEIGQGQLDDTPVDNRLFTEKMGEWFDKHPEKKDGAAYKFFTAHIEGKYKKAQKYEPKFKTWEERKTHEESLA